MITLDQLLSSRDARVAFQQQLLKENPGACVVCLTVQLPGPVKRNATSLLIGKAGADALRARFPGAPLTERDLPTGYEAYLPLQLSPAEAKRIACELEETHPLGRLMDIDVIGPDGPVSRADIGLEPRRCLLCGNEVRYCMRAKSHSREELLARIDEIVSKYIWNTENSHRKKSTS